MSAFGSFTRFFLPRVSPAPALSQFEGDPDQARRERPLPTRAKTRWYQSDVEAAIAQADQGVMVGLAKLARAVRRDGVAGGVLSTRTTGLTRLPKHFRGTPSAAAGFASSKDRGLGIFDRVFSPQELALLNADGLLIGVGVGELLRIPNRELPIFVRLDPEHLIYRWAEDSWYYTTDAGQVRITPGDGRWVFHAPGGYQKPWENALVTSVGRAYIAKDHAFQYRENYSGKLANPARVAYAPAAATQEESASWLRQVMAWGVNTVFGLRPGYEVKLLESNGRGYEIFEQTIASCNEEMIVGFAGQMVTTTGGTGFANAGIHATIKSDLVQADGDGLAFTLNSQAIPHVANECYGAGAEVAVEYDTAPPSDRKADADAMTATAGAIESMNKALAPYGLKVDAREMATRCKVPLDMAGAPAPVDAPGLDDANAIDTVGVEVEEEAVDISDTSAEDLAAAMTEMKIARCEHGKSNRCRLCGIERVREPRMDRRGLVTWGVKWRAIAPSLEAAS